MYRDRDACLVTERSDESRQARFCDERGTPLEQHPGDVVDEILVQALPGDKDAAEYRSDEIHRRQRGASAIGSAWNGAGVYGRIVEGECPGLVDGYQLDVTAIMDQLVDERVAWCTHPEHGVHLALLHGEVGGFLRHWQGNNVIAFEPIVIRKKPKGSILGTV